MTFDVLLAHRCPHEIVEERSYLGPDRRTLISTQSLTSKETTQVIANDDTVVPNTGLYSQAYIKSGLSGPFKFTDRNNLLVITTPSEKIQLTIATGIYLQTSDIVNQIKGLSSKLVVSNTGGYLSIMDMGSTGLSSSIKVSGTSLEKLGFTQTGARGRLIYPAWDIVNTPGDIRTKPIRYVRFASPVKSNPVFYVTYLTTPEQCTRCRATGIENDLRYDSSGEAILITDENLLTQAALKIVLTKKGSNPYYVWYGSNLQGFIGSKTIASVKSSIELDVTNALNNYMQVQKQQAKFQNISTRQRFYRIVSVIVTPDPQNPTLFRLDMTISNASNQAFPLTIVYTVGDVITLPGSNGLTLNFERSGLSLPA